MTDPAMTQSPAESAETPLVERLRFSERWCSDAEYQRLFGRAADRIEQLERELAEAQTLLRSRNCDDLCLEHIKRAEKAELAAAEATERASRALCDLCREYPGTAFLSKHGDWGHKVPDGDRDPYYLPCRGGIIRAAMPKDCAREKTG